MRLGELLVAMGAASRDAIGAALENQVFHGGRLGTNLLELGAVGEAQLADALGRQHRVASRAGDVAVEPAALKLLAPERADRLGAVPLAIRGRALEVLVTDPHDLAKLDELAFATGKTVRPFVVAEARLAALLARCYGIVRPGHGVALDAAPAVEAPASPAPAAPVEALPDLMGEAEFTALYASVPPAREPAPPGFVSGEELLGAVQAEASQAAPRRGDRISLAPAAAPAAAIGFDDAVAALAGVTDRSAIARTVLRYARSRYARAVLLAIHGDVAEGWDAAGDGLSAQAAARVRVRVDQPGVVQTAVRSRSHVLGPVARSVQNAALLRAIGGGVPKSALALPILARGRVVNVLYADGGKGGLADPEGVGELLILATRISQAYERLLSRAG